MSAEAGIDVPLWRQGYAVFVKLWDLTPDSPADETRVLIDTLDEALLAEVRKAGLSKESWFQNPYGASALFPDVDRCLTSIAEVMAALNAAGALISVGVAWGHFERNYSVSGWNTAAIPVNTAARLASIAGVQGHVAVDPKVRSDMLRSSGRFSSLAGAEQTGIVKDTEFRYHILHGDSYRQNKQGGKERRPGLETDAIPSTPANIVSFDIEKFSRKTASEQAELSTTLFKCVEESLNIVGRFGNRSEYWVPAGDGGQVIFPSARENSSPQAWRFAQSMLELTSKLPLALRIGLDHGPILASKHRAAVGGALLRADEVSARANANGIAVSTEFWASLPDRMKTGIATVPSPDPGVVVVSGVLGERYITVPPLPPNYVARPEALEGLRAAVLKSDSPGIALTALEGMGGIGKSVLAQALCHDPAVQEAFPDGIIWVTAGRGSAYDLKTKMQEVGKALGDDLSRYDTEAGCINQYRTTMRKMTALIVVDDVWSARDLEPFRFESARSRLLFTTRTAEIAAGVGARQHRLDLLTEEQSRELLAGRAGVQVEDLPPEAADLIVECGRLPLAVAMTGAMLRGKPASYWKRVLERLRRADLASIRGQFPDYPHTDLLRAIQVSVDALEPTARERYLVLAVLLEHMPIHPAIQQTLWNVDEGEAEETAEQLLSLSLAQREGESIRLHDLQLDYVRARYADREALRLMHDAVRLSSNVIANDPRQFASQLVARLLPHQDHAPVGDFLKLVTRGAPRPWLRALHPALQPPGTGLIRTLEGHSSRVNRVALTADGHRAVSASSDHTLKVWDLETGQELQTLKGHSKPVEAVAVSGDGRRVLSASEGCTLKIWDVESGRELHTLECHPNPIDGVALTKDGRCAVWSQDKILKVWDVQSGREVRTLEGHSLRIFGLTMSADGRRAVSASSDRTLKVWDLETGRELRTLDQGYSYGVDAVALSADGRRAVSASHPYTMKVLDLESGRELFTLPGHSSYVTGVAVSGDGKRGISASHDQTLKVWDLETGLELRTLRGHSDHVTGVAVSADGRRAVSASKDRTLKVWDVERSRELRTVAGHSGAVNGVAMSAHGLRALSASNDMTLKVWDVGSGWELRTLERNLGVVSRIALSPDGRRAISGYGLYRSSPVMRYTTHTILKIWDIESGRELCIFEADGGGVNAVAVSGDLRRAVSGSYNMVKVWDLTSGRELRVLRAHSDHVSGLSLSADGRRIVSASYDKTLKVWDVESGRELRTLAGHSGRVNAVAVTPDGRRAISASYDETLKVWNVETGQELRPLRGHSGEVNGVAVSADGRRVVSASDDKTLKLWDLESGEPEATFTCDSAALCCALANDGTIVAGDRAGHVFFLSLELPAEDHSGLP